MIMNPVDLAHTPGVNYALAYWASCMIFSLVLPRRSLEVGFRWLIRGLLLVGLISFMMLTDGVPKFLFIPCILLDVVMMTAFLYSDCDLSLRKTLYFVPRVLMLGEFASSMEWQLLYYLEHNHWVSSSLWFHGFFLILIYGLVFSIGYFREKEYRVQNEEMTVSDRQMWTMIMMTVSIYTISNLSFITQNTPFSGSSTSEIFIIRSLVDLGGVGILLAMHLQNQSMSIRMHSDYLQKLLAMQYDNYRIHEESVRLVNQKYHDLKHQIALLRQEITAEEKLSFLNEMERDIKSYEAQNKTGNDILDTILTARSLQCQSEGISLTCTVDGRELSFMNAMDISVLFGNALDNAIESVRRIEEREKRLIHLTVNRQKGFVRIHMENCYVGEVKMLNGLPVTSKQDTNFHGFGIKSIQTIVDKYEGSLTLHAENGWFELRILFADQS